MEFDEFRQSAFYQSLADPIRVSYALWFLDPELKGVTYSEILEALAGDVDKQSLSVCLDVLVDRMELDFKLQSHDGLTVQTYNLFAWHYDGLKQGVELLDSRRSDQ